MMISSRSTSHRPRTRREPQAKTLKVGVSCEEIARLAYSYWEARGRQHGSANEDWFRAERELWKPKVDKEYWGS